MDKNTFMKELERSLSVLQKDELKDILSEYEQHIDMKVKSGLSEEEAIEDFGSLSELTADILGAYHVRPDYAAEKKSFGAVKIVPKAGIEKIKNVCRGAGKAMIRGICGTGRFIWKILVFLGNQGKRPFVWFWNRVRNWKKTKAMLPWGGEKEAGTMFLTTDLAEAGTKTAPMQTEQMEAGTKIVSMQTEQMEAGMKIVSMQTEQTEAGREMALMQVEQTKTGTERTMKIAPDTGRRRKPGSGFLSKIGGLLVSVFHFGMQTVLWCIRLVWNAGWLGVSLFFGLCGLVSLFGLGLLVVLLLQRYPLAGLTIGCTGLTLCMFSAAWLGITFLWKKDRKKEPSACREGAEGEQYA